MKRRIACAAVLAATLAAPMAQSAEFKSVGASPAILYDAPSERGRRVFVAPRGMPVEVVLSYGEWTKVRDVAGDLSWVEAKALDNRRHVLVSVPGARVRASADEAGAVVFTADKGVLLELAEPISSGWVKVRHRDGQGGYIRATDIWGD